GDGWPDIFVARHWHPANLWLNNKDGTFSPTDVTYFQSITDRHDCPVGDFNKDGLKDLFCSVGADRGSVAKSNALYLQQPDHTFVEQAYQWNVSDPWGRGRYGATLDANNDSHRDIFYGTESLRPDGMPSINRFYVNTGTDPLSRTRSWGSISTSDHCARTRSTTTVTAGRTFWSAGKAAASTCSETIRVTDLPMCPRSSGPRRSPWTPLWSMSTTTAAPISSRSPRPRSPNGSSLQTEPSRRP